MASVDNREPGRSRSQLKTHIKPPLSKRLLVLYEKNILFLLFPLFLTGVASVLSQFN